VDHRHGPLKSRGEHARANHAGSRAKLQEALRLVLECNRKLAEKTFRRDEIVKEPFAWRSVGEARCARAAPRGTRMLAAA
jgi:hypothetical protein